MDPKQQEQVAAFRYGLIAPIVSRQTPLAPGEMKAFLAETASREYLIPGSHKCQVSVRSLERYIAQYRQGGWDALKPQGRTTTLATRIPPDVFEAALRLRRERPERSVEQLVFLLEEGGIAQPGSIARSTLARHLRQARASRRELVQEPNQGYRRFEAEDLHLLWQSDFQHTLYLPDPKNPKKNKKAILCAILDDYSRLVVAAQFYWDEKLPRLEDSLKKAILRHGVPEQFYCDNGAVFSSQHLERVCGKCGIRLSHSRPFRPSGRGKIERFFRFVDTSFKPEAYEQIQKGRITTLEQLNEALTAWIDGFYHRRKHGSTEQTPFERAAASSRQPRRLSPTELTEIFLWEEQRKADKASCIQLSGNSYEVDQELARKTVTCRYDPFDLSVIQVWFEHKRYADAKPVDLTRRYHQKVAPDPVVENKQEVGQISFFDLAEHKRREHWEQDTLSYAKPGRDDA